MRSESSPFPVLILSAWCGLVSGLLEVGTIVVRKHTFDPNHLYGMSRHFVWLIPLINLCVFLALGIVLKLLVLAWPRRGPGWHSPALLVDRAPAPPGRHPADLRPGLVCRGGGDRGAAGPGSGAACHRSSVGWSGQLSRSSPVSCRSWRRSLGWRPDQGMAREHASRCPPGSPNVLLIVLDTVAADHLSLYGYDRPTSPTLDRLAERGIRFDRAQATSSWTLPSHASLFTGRWPHELSAGWLTPLDAASPTLAEFLGSRGFATAGFIANYGIAPPTPGWAAASPFIETISSPGSRRSRRPSWSIGPWTGSQAVERSSRTAGIDLD